LIKNEVVIRRLILKFESNIKLKAMKIIMQKMMKLLPALAFVAGAILAIGTSSFKTVLGGEPDGKYTFKYNPPTLNPYSAANVGDLSLWSYDANASGCDDENEAACTIRVTDASVDNASSAPTLKSNFVISVLEGPVEDVNYVSSTSDGLAEIINRTAE
jgi:hypothetical protein